MLTPSLFHENFDLFDHFYPDPWFGSNDHDFKDLEKKLYGHRAKNVMNTDIQESDSAYEMTVDLPGFQKEDVTVSLENGYLTINATKGVEKDNTQSEDEKSEGKFIRKERYSGSCQRSFYIGDSLEVSDIKANFQHGILKLTIPKKDPKQVTDNKYVAIEG